MRFACSTSGSSANIKVSLVNKVLCYHSELTLGVRLVLKGCESFHFKLVGVSLSTLADNCAQLVPSQ